MVMGQHGHEDENKRYAGYSTHAASHDRSDLFCVIENSEQLETQRRMDQFEIYMIEQQHSYACLETTAGMFESLCSQLGVFHCLKDMAIYLGQRTCEVEVAPPRPRWKSLGRESKHGWESTYGLRWVEENDRKSVWSLRQSVIYNRTDFERDAASWIILAPTSAVKEDLDEFISRRPWVHNAQQVALHLAFIQSAIVCWRPYLVFLTEQVGENVSLPLFPYHNADPSQIRDIKFANPKDAKRLGADFVDLTTNGTRLKLKTLEDQTIDAILALEANRDVVKLMKQLLESRLSAECTATLETTWVQVEDSITEYMTERILDIDMLLKKLQSLQAKLASCTQIASSFSELSNGHTLQQLAEAAHKESERTTELTRRTQRDGAAVKALTLITLIYLPTTVVLVSQCWATVGVSGNANHAQNFFSASFIDTARGEIVLVGKWWLFLIICMPLTAITICAWQFWVWRQSRLHGQPDEENSCQSTLNDGGRG